jgi:hypothetical protein
MGNAIDQNMEMRDVLRDLGNIYKVQGKDCNSVPNVNQERQDQQGQP